MTDYEETGGAHSDLPEATKTFLTSLRNAATHILMPDLYYLYDSSFNKLVDKHYKTSRLPSPSLPLIFSKIFNNSEYLLCLYKDLYYRHIYSVIQRVNFDDRVDTYNNYCSLFSILSNNLIPNSLPSNKVFLPPNWIFEMVNEFILQYMEYCMYKVEATNPDDIILISKHPDVWSTPNVMKLLHQISKINLLNSPPPKVNANMKLSFTTSTWLGLCAQYGIVYLNVLLADYNSAISAYDTIQKSPSFRTMLSRILPLFLSSRYYYGFSLLMMRRVPQAIKAFSQAISHYNRFVNTINRLSYSYDYCHELANRLYCLLAISLALHPQKIDDHIYKQLIEKVPSFPSLCSYSIPTFEELFKKAAPAFIIPSVTRNDMIRSDSPKKYQLSLFVQNVKLCEMISLALSYLNLYSSISISKLEKLIGGKEDIHYLLLFISEQTTDGPISFHIDNDIIYVKHNTETATNTRSNFYLKNSIRIEDMINDSRRK